MEFVGALLLLGGGIGALWVAFILVVRNPLEETFENSVVNFVPGPLIPYLLYGLLAFAGGWAVITAVSKFWRFMRSAVTQAGGRGTSWL